MGLNPQESEIGEESIIISTPGDIVQVPIEVMRKEESILVTPSLPLPTNSSVVTEVQRVPTLLQTTSKPMLETTENVTESIISDSPEPKMQERPTIRVKNLSPSIFPFDQHYQLIFFTTIELFGKKVRIPFDTYI